jgi:hypothetical protein
MRDVKSYPIAGSFVAFVLETSDAHRQSVGVINPRLPQNGENPAEPNRGIWRCCQIGYPYATTTSRAARAVR